MRQTISRTAIALAMAVVVAAWFVPAVEGEGPAEEPGTRATGAPAPAPRVVVTYPTRVATSTVPLRDLPPSVPSAPSESRQVNPIEPRDFPGRSRIGATSEDPLRQNFVGGDPMPDPIRNIEGQSDQDNADVVGVQIVPPDTNGDVGPNHYVQWINLILAVYDKTSDGPPILGPIPGNQIFTELGGGCALGWDAGNHGDPTVLYDQFADRWVISQFWNPVAAGSLQCVAVSTTGDPTGTYHLYEFPTPGNDYPKMGVWPDAYYMTYRNFGSGAFIQAVALERDAMLNGDPAAMVRIGIPDMPPDFYEGVLPPHIEGLIQPGAGAPAPYVMAFDDEAFSNSPDPTQDFYKIWHFSVDWDDPGASTVSGPIDVPTEEMDINLCGFGSCVPQPSPGELLDHLSFFTMWRAVYHGATDTLWVNNTVDADGADTAGIRWAEISDPTGSPSVKQAGTYAPADGEHRWMGSLAVDDSGNMALGFSLSSGSTFPSIRYAGRLADDPPGVLGQGEAELWAGTGSQTGSANRWGDYSSMSLDESDGCTFWYTQEYYETTGGFDFNTRIGSFQYITCVSNEVGTIRGTVTDMGTGEPIAGASVNAVGANNFSTSTDENGEYSMLVVADTYDVTASAFGYEPLTETGVVVADGAEVTRDFALEQAALVDIEGFVTDGSGAGWPLYASVTIDAQGTDSMVVYTDPATGFYAAEGLVVGVEYLFLVEAIAPAGYVPEGRAITPGVDDPQQDFALLVSAACTTPGYEFMGVTLEQADFGGGIPGDWSVQNSTTGCTSIPEWNTDDPAGRGNMTGGSGLFAIADSDICGSSVSMNTDLITPEFDLSASGEGDTVHISWNQDYVDLGSTADVQAWDGEEWVTIASFGGSDDRGPVQREASTTVGIGLAAAQYRWHYVAGWDWWWEVDDVEILAGPCEYTGAAVIYGNVYDTNTGNGVIGATVELDTGDSVSTVGTPDDPNLDDGFYSITAPLPGGPAAVTMTVTASGYLEQSRAVFPTPGTSQREDFELAAGLLSVAPEELRARVAIGGTGVESMTLFNTGTNELVFDVVELNFPPPALAPEGGWPQEVPDVPLAPSRNKEDYQLSVQTDSRDVPQVEGGGALSDETFAPTVAGDWVGEFPTGLPVGWGAGWDLFANTAWISNIGAGGGGSGEMRDYEFLPDGTPTGDSISSQFPGGVWGGDLAFNSNTGMLWQVNVGGDNCLYELDPVALEQTGNTVCGPWGISQRGVAYNPAANTFFVAGWNDDTLYEVSAVDGSLVRSVVKDALDPSGLAYNPLTQHLFVQVNNAVQVVHVFDAAQPDLPSLGTITLLNEDGTPAYGSFEGAGLEFDCVGNLVSVNQVSQTVYFHDPGEAAAGCEVDIPWFTPDPTTGTIEIGGSANVDGLFEALNMPPRCEEAHVRVKSDTPYGDIITPVGITVAFNDVSDSHQFDGFIHGIATEQISLGCGGGNFCPGNPLLRNVMAVWMVRAKYGVDFAVPPATGLVFEDVGPEEFAADEIEFIFNEGIVVGCLTEPALYCPTNPVNRGQMSVFLLRSLEGGDYVPPPCSGIFVDVACPSTFGDWIEDLYNRGITSGCAADPLAYCPANPVNRGQMSVFLSRTFGLAQCQQ